MDLPTREKNCRYLDIFEERPALDDEDTPLAFLVALLVIKLRTFASYDATCQSVTMAFETTCGQRIQEVQTAVTDMLIVSQMVNIDSQRRQVERLINLFHRNNPSTLPAILNPHPILKRRRPPTRVQGDPAEVYDLLNYCLICFLRVPSTNSSIGMLEQ